MNGYGKVAWDVPVWIGYWKNERVMAVSPSQARNCVRYRVFGRFGSGENVGQPVLVAGQSPLQASSMF